MILQIMKGRTVGELQQDFNQAYPYLKVDVLKEVIGNGGPAIKQRLTRNTNLSAAGRLKEGALQLDDSMTVGQLEKIFRELFGINVQVSRKSGPVWLETTVTDTWTLKQQNEHGRELSIPVRNTVPEERVDWDQ